jgi:hypothetical protein
LKFIRENKLDELYIDLSFSYEINSFGAVKMKDLKPNGRNIPVTDENKDEYIKLICYAKMADEIKT